MIELNKSSGNEATQKAISQRVTIRLLPPATVQDRMIHDYYCPLMHLSRSCIYRSLYRFHTSNHPSSFPCRKDRVISPDKKGILRR